MVTDSTILFSKGLDIELDKDIIRFKSNFNSLKDKKRKFDFLKTLSSEFKTLNSFEFYVPFFKHHYNWDILIAKEPIEELEEFNKGALFVNRIKPIDKYLSEYEYKINDFELKYFEKFIELANQNDIEVIVLVPPRANHSKSQEDQLLKLTEKLNFTYIVKNSKGEFEGLELDYKKDFYNSGHLNTFGNRKFSDYLGKYIYDNYGDKLIKKRDDKKNQEWDSYVEEYNNYYNKALKEIE